MYMYIVHNNGLYLLAMYIRLPLWFCQFLVCHPVVTSVLLSVCLYTVHLLLLLILTIFENSVSTLASLVFWTWTLHKRTLQFTTDFIEILIKGCRDGMYW